MPVSRTRISLCRLASLVLLGSVTVGPDLVEAQTTRPKVDRSSDQPTPIASTRPDNSSLKGSIASPVPVQASIKVEGTPSPALQVTLDGSASTGGRVWYRWLQTQGPTVEIEGANQSRARFTVPVDASSLSFVLVIGNASGVDAKAVTIEVDDSDGQGFRADAGDDQTARIGRRVVLNGVRSEPKGKLRYRWVQADGPKVVLKPGEGPTTSFLPSVPGTYQFALIVATSTGELSQPSTVTITVGGTVRASADAPTMAIDELARVSLASIEGGSKYAEDISKTFDTIADGIDSFKTFSDAINGMTRQLDAVVPRDKDRRAVWIEQFFSPLMAKLVVGMKTEGIDLTQPEAQAKPLTKDQKARLAEQFRYTAAGLRASKTLR
jgi:hypothetical protein